MNDIDMQIIEENKVDESMIPLNFDFKTAKTQMVKNKNDYYDLNPNDPVVKQMKLDKELRDKESQKQQIIANYRQYARNILSEILTSINNLIKGNAKVGFTETDHIILVNSLKNKINEILIRNSNYINNTILFETIIQFEQMAISQYNDDIIRYKLEDTKSNIFAYNTKSGILVFNPNLLYNLVNEFIPSQNNTIEIDNFNNETQYICE